MAGVTIGNRAPVRADYPGIEPPIRPRTRRLVAPRPTSALRWPVALVVVLATVLGTLTACSSGDGGGSSDKAGTLPDAKLQDLATGKAADWPAGKPLVVNFWASWCTPCRKEMPAFQAVHEALGDRVAIVGVTDDPHLDKARNAAKTSGARYPLLVDVDTELLIDFSIAGLPATVFVDEDGKILGRHLGAMTEAELTKEIRKRYGIEP